MAGKQLKVSKADAAVLERALLVAAATLEPEEMSQRQLFEQLMPRLYVMRKKGFSFVQITEVLEAAGLRLSAATVRSYYADYQQTNMEVLEAQWERTSAALKKLQTGSGSGNAAAAAQLLLGVDGTDAAGGGRRRGGGAAAGTDAAVAELARDVREVRDARQAAIDAVAVADSRDLVRALAANGAQRRTSNGLRPGVVERMRGNEGGDGVADRPATGAGAPAVVMPTGSGAVAAPSPASVVAVQAPSGAVSSPAPVVASVESLMGLSLPGAEPPAPPSVTPPVAPVPVATGGVTDGVGGVDELRQLKTPEERKTWVANRLSNGLGGQPLPVVPPVKCLTEPKSGESFTAAQLADMPAEVRESDEVLEHPAIAGLMLTRAQRLYGKRLQYADGDGFVFEEPVKLVSLRIKWQRPAPKVSGESARGFVKIDVGRLGGQKI